MTVRLEDLKQKLVKKALEDLAFKKELITNPKETIENFAKKELSLKEFKLPDKLQIKVVEETEKLAYLVIPHFDPKHDITPMPKASW